MKLAIVLTTMMSLFAVEVFAGPACDIDKFKRQYIDLQNALRYEGSKIEYKKGKIVVSNEQVSNEDTPGKKTEQILYNNYVAALGKVKKIYEHLNGENKSSEEKTLTANDEVTKFFKAIDPNNSKSTSLDLNIEKLIDQLKKVKGKSFSLNENDAYLLKKLIAHSQDRVCTLEKYLQSKQGKVKYLEDLRKEPLNKMIEQLRGMMKTDDVQFAVQDLAIDQAVEEGINNLHQLALVCKNALYSVKFDEPIQACNYNKFIKSLGADDSSFRSFEAILHFINANQKATNAATSLDMLKKEFKNESPVKCTLEAATKKIFVQNLPLKNNEIDPNIIRCVKKGKETKGDECLKGMKISLENGKGHSFTPEEDSGIEKLTIANSSNCANFSFTTPPKKEEPKKEEPKKEEPKKDETIKLDLYQCTEVDCRAATKKDHVPNWNKEKNQCEFTNILSKSDPIPFCSLNGRPGETADSCKAKNLDLNSEDRTCIETEATCKVKNLSFDSSTKKCVEDDNSCKVKKMIFSKDTNSCVENADTCEKKKLSFDSSTKSCVESEKSCKDKGKVLDEATKQCKDPSLTEEDCGKQNKKLNEAKNACIELSKKEECDKKNADAAKDRKPGDEVVSDPFEWKDNSCVERKPKKEGAQEGQEEEEKQAEKDTLPKTSKPLPPRFQPVIAPTRQMFIMPGMP